MTFTIESASGLAILVAAIVAAVSTGVVNIIVALRSSRQVDKSVKTTDAIMEKTLEIHTSTNGTLSRMENALGKAQQKIDGLEQLVASMIKAADAQTAAVGTAMAATPPTVIAGIVPQVAAILPAVHAELKAVAELSADTNETAHRIEDTVKPT